MDKRGIALIFILVMALGIFFQLSRMDAFLHLLPLRNLTQLPAAALQGEDVELARDKYLLLYDPRDVGSVFARHRLAKILAQQKKDCETASIYDADTAVASDYRGVLLATGCLERVACLPAVREYARAGGTVAVLMHLEAGGSLPQDLLSDLGVAQVGKEAQVRGIHIWTDFLFGGKGVSFGEGTVYDTVCTEVSLQPDATLHISAENGQPLLWEHEAGKGKYLVYNGSVRDDKTNAGLLTAMIAHCGEEDVYPVLGTKLFFIDDFPSPVPEGKDPKIYDELQMTTADFYRNRWWPYMRQVAKDFDLKYTGLIIESYGDQVEGDFAPPAGSRIRNDFIIYGRELLGMGGELGLHGYNHQSLAPEGYNQGNLDYKPWPNQQAMVDSMKELRRYVKDAYPDYEFKAYVPPSDILSPEGRAAIREVFPEVRIFSSLFDGVAADKAYITDFERHDDDDTFEIPRVSAGYAPSAQNIYEQVSVLNYIGCFSHFVHPDEMFYEESKDISWATMEESLRAFLTEFQTRYGWLRPVTDSECADYFADYLDMDYRVQREADRLRLYCWNFRYPLRFILHTQREIDHADGARFERIGADCYMIETQAAEAALFWKEEK
ncbi:hypothetical protein SAMN02910356_00836 [Selenomonas sp. GACV-9]|uniref:DUF2194 domain-containing protein n=1 Tax=Selenomonas sp. GACV-9 TaxID=3158782 RepID=UPI0008F1B923|nr:hypothetical protein SAMN02910356_00836 [Selenomonas ruminantium]